MADPFVHLRVASGYSMRYGASHPAALIAAAVSHEMSALALTDRDGLYGVVRFAKECLRVGIAPIVGVDAGFTFGRRAVLLAESRRGWASACRLVGAIHSGERGRPLATTNLVSRHRFGLVVVLGDDSDLGAALAARDVVRAERVWRRWLEVVEPHQLVVGVTNHLLAGDGPGSASLAGRMLAFADAHGVVGVLTNAVRMARRTDAPVADVLDATRRLVPLDLRNVDRRNAEGYLKSGKEMLAAAEEVCRLAGRPNATQLIGATRDLAIRCSLDPRADLGLGEIHLPEFEVLGGVAADAPTELRQRCEVGLAARYGAPGVAAHDRLAAELEVIDGLGFASYFLTVANVVDMTRRRGIRVAARGSGAGSLVNYALGISGVDPLRYDLIMERFCSPLRKALPDIDIDVESARRLEVYDLIFDTFGRERVAAVAMLDTYRARHAIRDVGAAMSLPPGEIDAIAKSFPRIAARDVRHALRELPELRRANLGDAQLGVLFSLVEALDGLPRHIALHPCGVILSDATLHDRTPVETSAQGYPMSQFDKDDVEDVGLLKLDVLGIRMQSAMAHAVREVERVQGAVIDLDALAPFDDEGVYDMIGRAETIGCFQIESPGQRELVGKFGPDCFDDLIVDISLFRPGPVKSDMVLPFLRARNGWEVPRYPHPDLVEVLRETRGVIVYHEQVIKVVSVMTGCSLAHGDEARRALSSLQGQADVRRWFYPAARKRGYGERLIDDVWGILESFASFGFCKAHAAAFALPTYQSAWLKHHHPAAFFAGLLTHDPGMYPKRLILAEARRVGVGVLPVDVNASEAEYTLERAPSGWGIRLALSEVRGITGAEVDRVIAARPFTSLTDFVQRVPIAKDVVQRLAMVGAFDGLYGIVAPTAVGVRGAVTRRDLLLTLADLERTARTDARARRGSVQLALDLSDGSRGDVTASGLPEFTARERLAAELDVLGLDASAHVLAEHMPFLAEVGVTWSRDLLARRSGSRLLVAGVKVATQTPQIRSGRRIVFLTLDDSTGPVDLTLFEDAQGAFARTVFNSWLLVGVGELRRTGPRGASLRALGAWDLTRLRDVWEQVRNSTGDARAATAAVHDILAAEMAEPQDSVVFRRSSSASGGGFVELSAAPFEVPSRKLWHSSPGSSGR